jgi:two-component system, NarL family, nitrate/nitrite response regulator NarL
VRVWVGGRKAAMISVLIADDQVRVRDIFRFLLENTGDIEIVGMASNGREAVEQVALCSPDVVVMDVSMPVMDGIEATRQIRTNYPETRVLMVSMHDNANYIGSSIQAGALGYVLKDAAGEELVTAVRTIRQDDRYFSKKIVRIAQVFLSDTEKPDPTASSERDLYPPPTPA